MEDNGFPESPGNKAELVLFEGTVKTKYSGEIKISLLYDRRFEKLSTCVSYPKEHVGSSSWSHTSISLKQHHTTEGDDPIEKYEPELEEQEPEWFDPDYEEDQ